MSDGEISRGLLIRQPHIGRILSGEKTWELRSSLTKQRGRIALIESGSGSVVGVARLVDAVGPLTLEQLEASVAKHRADHERLRSGAIDKYNYAWVFEDARRLKTPIKYEHPPGAVIWVSLQPSVSRALADHA